MKLRLPALSLVAAAISVAPLAALAQWPANADSAVVISDAPGEQVQPKIVALDDGGYYVSWFDGGGQYDVRLQRYDRNGNALWATGGILVANRNVSSTVDYGLDRDPSGNAVLAFRLRGANGALQAMATKIAPDGSRLWAAYASAASNDVQTVQAAATADGGMVVAWLDDSGKEILQRFDATGHALWDDGVAIQPPSGAFVFPGDVHGSGNDAIVSFVIQSRTTGNQLWAQKYDPAGQPLWSPGYVKLWEDTAAGTISMGDSPVFLDDGAGGAVFCWQYVFNAADSANRIQHVLADGSELYAHNGISPSTDTRLPRGQVACSYDARTGDVYALWRVIGTNPDDSGIQAQRVDANGSLLWDGKGKTLVPINPNSYSNLIALPARDGFIAQWNTDSLTLGDEPLDAAAIRSDGTPAWRLPVVQYKQFEGYVGRVAGAPTRAGGAVFVWENNPPADPYNADLVMQKVGAFGGVGSPGH